MLSKGVHRCDVVSLLFVSPDAKKNQIFSERCGGTLKKIYTRSSIQCRMFDIVYVQHTMTSKLKSVRLV